MSMIQSIDARYAQSQVGVGSAKVAASVSNLSSGTKSNANVADLSVGTVLASRVNTLRVAVNNAGQAKSLLDTAKGALTTIIDLIQQQKALTAKAADDSLTDNERGFLDQEFQALTTQIDRIASTTNFNGKTLIDGSINGNGLAATGAAAGSQYITGFGTSVVSAGTFTILSNNKVVGSQSDATVTATKGVADTSTLNMSLNGQAYTAILTDASQTSLVFKGEGGAILTLTTSAVLGSATQDSLDVFAASVQSDLRSSTVTQTRVITASGISYAGGLLAGVSGAATLTKSSQFSSDGTSAPSISGFTVSTAGEVTARVGSATYSGTLTAPSATVAANTITLTNTADSTQTFTIALTGLTATINATTTAGSAGLASALNTAFSSTTSSGGLSFQVGVASTDTISVTIGSAASSGIGTSGASVDTKANALAASDLLDTALNTVVSLVSTVSAGISAFDASINNNSSSIQNADAARSSLLDTDYTAEATTFAESRVMVDAAIAVLTQVNTRIQNLLGLLRQ